jgi:predicted  nucleic acid-binding Zn-ribbon protein
MSAKTEIQNLLVCLVQNIAADVGDEIKDLRDQLAVLAGMPAVDLTEINNKLATLQSLLDADPNTEGFQTAQNLINTLTGLTARVAALEDAAGTAAGSIATLEGQVAALEGQISQIQSQIANGTGGEPACDCAALEAALAAAQTALSNLTATDVAQASQIADLQGRIAAAEAGVGAIATLQAQVAALQAVDTLQGTQIAALQSELAELGTMSCTELTGSWRSVFNAHKLGLTV